MSQKKHYLTQTIDQLPVAESEPTNEMKASRPYNPIALRTPFVQLQAQKSFLLQSLQALDIHFSYSFRQKITSLQIETPTIDNFLLNFLKFGTHVAQDFLSERFQISHSNLTSTRRL